MSHSMMEHPDPEVVAAVIRLLDVLCQWERAIGRSSVVVIREVEGFEVRAVDGKPDIPADIPDAQLFQMLKAR